MTYGERLWEAKADCRKSMNFQLSLNKKMSKDLKALSLFLGFHSME